MSKIRTLIVEDEPRMARFLESLATKAGCYVVAACENCESALEILGKEACDLLITDINMPDQSGLELIRRAKAELPRLHVLIVSGHKDFAYAKEAIRLAVDYYITKPISQEEFFSALHQIRERTRLEKHKEIQKQFANALERYDGDALKNLFPWRHCRMLALYEKEFLPEPEGTDLDSRENAVAFYHNNIRYILLGGTRQQEGAETELIQWGQRRLMVRVCRTCGALIVSQVELQGDLMEKLHLAERNLREHTFLGKKNLRAVACLTEASPLERIPDETSLRRIKAEIYARNIPRLKQEIANLLTIWESSNASVSYISRKLSFLAEKMEKNLPYGSSGSLRERFQETLRMADDYPTFAQKLLPQIDGVFLEAARVEKRNRQSPEQIFLKIQQLLAENEEENYSLQEISQIFQLSQPYIRSLFKQYTGKGFKEYILDEKISLAKQIMLADPGMLVKDVAQRIGFEQLYFAKVFSKYTGMTPTQFKLTLEEGGADEDV